MTGLEIDMERTKCAGMGEVDCEFILTERCDRENCIFFKTPQEMNKEVNTTAKRLLTLPQEEIRHITKKYSGIKKMLSEYLFGKEIISDGT